MKYRLGEVVRLRSGGPNMTVVSITSEPAEGYKCSWFNDGVYSFCEFEVFELTDNNNELGFRKRPNAD